MNFAALLTFFSIILLVSSNDDLVKASSDKQGKIAGGTQAARGQFPHQVLIGFNSGNSTVGITGGTLLAYNWVLTTVGLLSNSTISSVIVLLGIIRTNETPDYSTEVSRQNFYIHPNFNANMVANNLAMIYLPEATLGILNSPYIGTVQLPLANETFVGQVGLIAGFGVTTDGTNQGSQDLYYVQQTIIPNIQCQQAYVSGLVTLNNICTNTTGGRSPCGGDYGGGLVINGTNILAGISSFTSAAGCTIGQPAVFVRIGGYLDWITGLMFNNSTNSTTPAPNNNNTTTTTIIPSPTTTTVRTTTAGVSSTLIGNILILFNIMISAFFYAKH